MSKRISLAGKGWWAVLKTNKRAVSIESNFADALTDPTVLGGYDSGPLMAKVMEAMILAHHNNWVDVSAPPYTRGIDAAFQELKKIV